MEIQMKNVATGTRVIAQAIEGRIIEGKKAPVVEVTFRVVEGEYTGFDTTASGSLSDNAQQYTLEMLRACGWSCDDITALTGLGSVKVALVAKDNSFTDDKGELRSFKQWSVYPLRSKKATLDPASTKQLAAQFRALAKSVPPVAVDDSNRAVKLPVSASAPQPSAGPSAATPAAGSPF